MTMALPSAEPKPLERQRVQDLLDSHAPAVHRLLLSLTSGDPQVTAELTHDTLARAWRVVRPCLGPVEQAHAQGGPGAGDAGPGVRLPAGRAARAAPERKESP